MTISAAAVAEDLGTFFERHPILQSVVRFVIHYWKIGLGRWYYHGPYLSSAKSKAVNFSAALSVAVFLLFGILLLTILDFVLDKDFRYNAGRIIFWVYFGIIVGLFLIIIIISKISSIKKARPFVDASSQVFGFISRHKGFRDITHLLGVPSSVSQHCYLSDGGHYENLGM